VNSISRFRWGPQLRPNQEYALSFIFDNTAANGKVLLVDRTGGGKSHVMRCAGVITRGIVLIVVPLLSLAADIIQKFDNDDDSHGIIDAIHFNEDIGSDNDRRAQLIADMCAIKRSTRRTLFLFISPQRLHKYIDLRRALLQLHNKQIFRYVMLDEFHLFAQHGVDFRREIRAICTEFIKVLMERRRPPYFLACTATCSLHNIQAFERMSGVKLSAQHRVWSDPASFRQRYIKMHLDFNSCYSSAANSKILAFFERDHQNSLVVYSNTAAQAKKSYLSLKTALDESTLPPIGVLLLHGAQHILEKFHYTRLFCQNSLEGLDFRGLIGTSAGDIGIDHPRLVFQVLLQLPRDMHSLIQRRGRLGRQGQDSESHLVMSLSDFFYTSANIEASRHKNDDNEHLDSQERETIHRARKDEFFAISSLVSLNLGCWHCRIERFCALGYHVHQAISKTDPNYPPCLDKCPICTGSWNKIFKPIFLHGLIHFLDSDYASRAFPMAVTDHKCEALSNLIWKNDDAIALIYDRKRGTIQKSNVDALVMQLLTLRIIIFDKIDNKGSGIIALAREKSPYSPFNEYRYKNVNAYYGIKTARIADGKERKNKYHELLAKSSLK
jgi:superfamily II DNA helicase RecQ